MVIVPVRELISVTLFSGCGDMDEEDHRYKLFIDHGDGGGGDGWYLVRCFDLTMTGDGMRFYSRIFPILFIRNSQNVFRMNWRRCGNEFEWWRRERIFFFLYIVHYLRLCSWNLPSLCYCGIAHRGRVFFGWCWTFVSFFYTMYIKSYVNLGRCIMY